jgi:hypothetical protein
LSSERRLRFRIRRGNLEIELEGPFDYVKQEYEKSVQELKVPVAGSVTAVEEPITREQVPLGETLEELTGILETTANGKPHFSVPFNSLTAKEAIGLLLFRSYPSSLSDEELSELLSSSWKTTKAHVVRARASELRKEGKLIADKGRYSLSGAGLQWIRSDILRRLRESRT